MNNRNTTVAGIGAILVAIGGVLTHNGYTTPTKSHNHMPSVSVWRSMIYGSNT